MFPFEETEDQLRAIEDTKERYGKYEDYGSSDLRRCRYGKTEIAIRAAFKAVQEEENRLFILYLQRFLRSNTSIHLFKGLKDFPVRVDLMSRFRTQAQQKKTVGFEKGLVDIVVRTHRVLSKDVGYKDLGLDHR